MPTLILLDVSLSMARTVETTEDGPIRVIDLASKFILNIIDHLSLNYNQEYVSLIVFSSNYEVVVKFTRDYELLRKACDNFQLYDKTVYESTLHGVESIISEEWGKTVAVNFVLITDGLCGIGDGSLKDSLSTSTSRKYDNRFPFPFAFPCHFTAVCLASEQELAENRKLFEHLIMLNYDRGEIMIPDSLSEIGMTQCFGRLINSHYKRFETTLKCGYFQSHVTLSPAPKFNNTYCSILNFYKHPEDVVETAKLKIGQEMNIIGFLELVDFGNPPFVSRHLVLPLTPDENKSLTPNKNKEKESVGYQPSFCVLLHGSLKMEKMGAVVKLGEDWYGMLYSWSDSKKKSNLMLSVFEPGHPFPWLGDLSYLGPAQEHPSFNASAKETAEDNPFPILPEIKHSYNTQCNAVWIKSSGLQSDIQKLLRYARKLPDKQSAFFKEVNKIRRAGMMYGFYDLLNALADALENESTNMKPEVVVQLRHVAEGLRNAPTREVNTNILAINTFRKKSE